MNPGSVIAWLWTLGSGEAREVLQEAKFAEGWAYFDEDEDAVDYGAFVVAVGPNCKLPGNSYLCVGFRGFRGHRQGWEDGLGRGARVGLFFCFFLDLLTFWPREGL